MTQVFFTGDGSTREYDVTFPFLSEDDVKLSVDGVDQTITWISGSRIQLATAPASGAEVRLYRDTQIDEALVSFQDGAVLSAADLNLADTQLLYKQQELEDREAQIRSDLNRTMRAPLGETLDPLPAAAVRANKVAAFNSSGSLIALAAASGVPELALPEGAGLIGMADGATVQEAVDDINLRVGHISPEQFGAVGDGAADDTLAWQLALAVGKHVVARKDAIYYTTASLGAPLDGATVDLNGSTIIADWEQTYLVTDPDARFEGVFALDGVHNVTIRGGKIEYVGTFDFGPSYDGLVSGVYAINSDHLHVEDMEITGFNRGGVFVGVVFPDQTNNYCKTPRVINSHCHHNRVVGVGYGSTDGGIVSGCELHWNGSAADIGTGYGFAGWSTGLPIDTIVENNQASDNYRKGLDFHSGRSGTLTGNVCSRNRNDGIYVMGVTGAWTITGNVISDMLWDNTFPTSSMYGIRVGDLTDHETTEPTTFVINGNIIQGFTRTAGTAYPLYFGGGSLHKSRINVSGNILIAGSVTQIAAFTNAAVLPDDWFDFSFTNNQVYADETTGVPFYIRGATNRKKVFSNNQIEIITAGSTAGLVLWDSTSVAGNGFIGVGNDIIFPEAGWSGAYDPLRVRLVPMERMEGNIVNGAPWRDWDGAKFIGRGPGDAPTDTWMHWTLGSLWWRTDVVAGGSPGSFCVTAGAPGTWEPIKAPPTP